LSPQTILVLPFTGREKFMSAHAYSEPYSYDRRNVRHQLRHNQLKKVNLHQGQFHGGQFQQAQPHAAPRKTADIVQLIPREFSREKQIVLVYPKYKGALGALAAALIIGLHSALLAFFYFKPEVPITQAEIPPMTLEIYRPPVEQPPAPVIPEELPPPPPP